MKEILILNGTCGSGKTTIAKQISELFCYYHIDSDEIIKLIKEKTGIRPEYNSKEIYQEYYNIIKEKWENKISIVLSSVFIDDDLKNFISFSNGNYFFRYFILFPTVDIAIKRTKKREFFSSITPEYWVNHFHEKINEKKEDVLYTNIIDNGDISIKKTVEIIMKNG
jgi:predicted ABC-type ATPase